MSPVPERFANLSPLQRAVLALQEVQAKLDAAERARTEPIAIVGIGCRIPGGAADPGSFWRLLRDGVSIVKEVPADRWDVDGLYDPDPDAPGKISTKWGGYLDEVDKFDPAFFGIAPREATTMDPQQRLLLEVSWEALEHAGIAADRLSGSRTGVFVGIAGHDYAELLRESSSERIDAYHASGIAHSIASGRLSYILGLQGPSISVDTACSSSLVAIHLASQSLRAGECRMALAGGVNLILTPGNSITFSKSHMLAPDGRCKTFDAAADGFARGEGCGVLVLKRLSDALADGDRICAVIRGTAANQDGPSSGLTAPNGPAQEAVIREALANGGVKPSQVSYVEAHGTGTSLGDPIEVQALGAALATGRADDQKVLIGSLKTNVGHLEAAAGVAGLIKVVLSLQHEAIPAHLNLQTLNPHIAWDELPVAVPTMLTPWPRGAQPRFAGVSSFGFSGTNVHIVLEEAPLPAALRPDATRSSHVLTASAMSEEALRTRVCQMRDRLVELDGEAAEIDIVHTANAGRAHHPHRLAVCGRSVSQFAEGLSGWLDGAAPSGVWTADAVAAQRPKVAFLFTGQGAQYAGMGRTLYETLPIFRQTLDRCDEILRPQLEHGLLSVIYGERTDLLDQTAYTQPALFAIEYALAAVWRSWGVVPSAVLGHSIGEYVAACVAGVLTLEDALTLVAARGRLMQALPCNGAMAAVIAPEDRVAPWVAARATRVSIAAVNGPVSVVVAGERGAIDDLIADMTAEGIKVRPLNVSHAFHSPLMDPVLEEFEAVASRIQFAAPRIRVVSNVTGQIASATELTSPRYWRDHVRSAVRFADGVTTLVQAGFGVFVEAGPSPTLIGMGMQCASDRSLAWVPSLRPKHDDWRQMTDGLASLYVRGTEIDWAGVDGDCVPRRITLPTYPFERERFWVEPDARRRIAGPAGPRESGHPLLGRRILSPAVKGAVFATEIGRATHGYLYDHRVHDTPILPATGFIEIAVAAGRELHGSAGAQLTDLSIHEALVLPEEGAVEVQVVLGLEEPTRSSFRIYSAVGDTAAAWKLHAEGRIAGRGAEAGLAGDGSIAATRGRCHIVTTSDFYEHLESRGLEFGPAFRGLTELWSGDGESVGYVELPQALRTNSASYVMHPVLLDSAVQVLAGAVIGSHGTDSFLPVHLESFELTFGTWTTLGAHAVLHRDTGRSDLLKADITFFDATDASRVIGRMTGLRLKRADRRAVRRQGAQPPEDWVYGVRWEQIQTTHDDADAPVIPSTTLAQLASAELGRVELYEGAPEYRQLLPQLEEISAAFIARALTTLGIPLTSGSRFSINGLAERLGLPAKQHMLFGRFLEILDESGVLRRHGGDYVATGKTLTEDPSAVVDGLLAARAACDAELTLIASCGPHLAGVLTGTVNPLSLLFPDGSTAVAERLYQESPPARFYNGLVQAALSGLGDRFPANRPIRILEIGGGTASTTAFALQRLPLDRIEYTFTDISPLFVSKAADRFADVPAVRAQVLDIERDPLDQGFQPQSFDLVIAANCLHATADLHETFDHVRELLSPGGTLLLLEVTRPLGWIDVTFGLTDGWWRFTDRDLRPAYPLLGRSAWLEFLTAAGFVDPIVVPGPGEGDGVLSLQSLVVATAAAATDTPVSDGRWLVLADRSGLGDDVAAGLRQRGDECLVVYTGQSGLDDGGRMHVDPFDAADIGRAISRAQEGGPLTGVLHLWSLEGDGTNEDMPCRSVLSLTQAMGAASISSRLVLVTRGAQPVSAGDAIDLDQSALWGLGRTIANEHPEWNCVRLDLDPSAGTDAQVEHILQQLRRVGAEPEVAVRGGLRYGRRLDRLQLGAAEERVERLYCATPGVLESLEHRAVARRRPGPGEVEIEVRAAALNFRDVVNALGLRSDSDLLGNECAGIIAATGDGVTGFRVGDSVIAIAPGSVASHTIANASLVVHKPATLRFEDAAGIPIVFVTADYALNHAARIAPGDRILIHAAAGGVGLAALQLAREAGAEVIATAGSARKRRFLHSLGVEHVFDSRSLRFADDVQRATGGRGVTVVLNSLAGEFIPASLGVLAPAGRFLEIGKNNIWDAQRVRAFRPDVEYFPIDLTADMEQAPASVTPALRTIVEKVASGVLGRVPRRVFDSSRATEAFRFMAQARHIGKVIISRRAGGRDRATVVKGLFDRPGTCLITGGLSGLGLATAQRLAERGCRSFALMGRSAPSSDAQRAIDELRERGVAISVELGDVSILADVARVLGHIDTAMPPLCGIVHSAGVLDDGALMQQEWRRFESVLAPKVDGARHLHQLTEHLPLDFFVLYSSVASVLGPRGQGNHAAANAFLDALAHARRAEGLAGLSINWGPWSGIGAAVRHGVQARVSAEGIGAIPPADGLALLEQLMASGATQAAVVPVDWRVFSERFTAAVPAFYARVARAAPARPRAAAAKAADAGAFLSTLLETPAARREKVLSAHVRELAARVLGGGRARTMDARVPLNEVGLDSLMAVELRNVLGASVGRTLPATLLFDHPTIDALTSYLLRELVGQASAAHAEAAVAAIPTTADVVDRIDELSDEEIDRLLAERMAGAK